MIRLQPKMLLHLKIELVPTAILSQNLTMMLLFLLFEQVLVGVCNLID
jgi:hypothetical protein